MYEFSFIINQDTGFKNIGTETAVALWDLFLKDKCLFYKDWITFIVDKKKPAVIKLDQWNMFYELIKQTKGNIKNFVDDGTWSSIIDEFIEYIQNK